MFDLVHEMAFAHYRFFTGFGLAEFRCGHDLSTLDSECEYQPQSDERLESAAQERERE